MLRCDLNKVAKQLYWNRFLEWMFSCKFAAYFQSIFPKNTSGVLLLFSFVLTHIRPIFHIIWRLCTIPQMLKGIEYYTYYPNVEHYLNLILIHWFYSASVEWFKTILLVFFQEFSTQNDPDNFHVILCLSYFFVGITASCSENNSLSLEEYRITSYILTLDDRSVEATGTFCLWSSLRTHREPLDTELPETYIMRFSLQWKGKYKKVNR